MTHSLQRPGVGRRLKSMGGSPLQSWRRLSGSLVRGLRSIQPYGPREVRARLLEDVSRGNPRTAAVHAAAADIAAWTRLLPNDASREHRLGLAASRLPSVVFWHRQGLSAEVIGQRLTPFGERCYGDRAIDAACGMIAALLNDDDHGHWQR